MSETKDYSLLRPFDPEAAKRGELLCGSENQNIYELCAIGTPKSTGESIAVRLVDNGWLYLCRPEDLRMAPICWVEGRPVYRGDVLYSDIGKRHVVAKVYGEQVWFESGTCLSRNELTWTPPKVKREGWVNVYPAFCSGPSRVANTSHAYKTKEAADSANCCNAGRIACVRIEWEEPAKVAK